VNFLPGAFVKIVPNIRNHACFIDPQELVPLDINQAAALYGAAEQAGHGDASCALGILFSQHNDPDRASEHFMKAVELVNHVDLFIQK
jgi:hypothetical protein